VMLTGIPMTPLAGGGGGYSLSSARYPNHHATSSSDPVVVKSVHFNTVHNCHQLTGGGDRSPAPGTPTTQETPAGGLTQATTPTPLVVGQSLPASYRLYRTDPHSSPTATISRHYAAQPRTIYPPGTVCPRAAAGGAEGEVCPDGVGSPHTVSPQCTVSDNGCVSPPPTSRLRHYCV